MTKKKNVLSLIIDGFLIVLLLILIFLNSYMVYANEQNKKDKVLPVMEKIEKAEDEGFSVIMNGKELDNGEIYTVNDRSSVTIDRINQKILIETEE